MRYPIAYLIFTTVAFGQLSPADQRIADLTDLIDRKPDFGAAYYARGYAYLSANKYSLAEPDFSKAIELKPTAAAYAGRGEVYLATQRPDLAITDLSSAIAIKPDNPNYYLRRANSYRAQGSCQQAIPDYSEAFRLLRIAEALRGRSACRKQIGDLAGAAEDDRVLENMDAAGKWPLPVATPTASNRAEKAPAPPAPPYQTSGPNSQPSILFKVEPEYSEEARKAKFQGTVTLSVVVSQFGEAQNIKVVKPLGLGLDQRAIESVQNWVFKAGRKDGQPVSVYATIEVTFHLL